MEEKILVKSDYFIRRTICLTVIVIIAFITIALPVLMGILISDNNNELIWGQAIQAYEKATKVNSEKISVCYHFRSYEGRIISGFDTHDHYYLRISCPLKYSSAVSFAMFCIQDAFQQRYSINFYVFCAICLFCPIALLVIYLWLKNYELVVTDKRVYGRAAFGKRVDLPIDSVSAIGTMWLKGISIATSSGKVAFLMIKNRDEIHKCVSDLLIDRQAKNNAPVTTIKQEIPQSNADELKKYKELLDMGVISQEEFDTKKKQLLGL